MRALVSLVALLAVPVALAGSIPGPTVLPRPGFPAPLAEVGTNGPELVLVSARYVDPATPAPCCPEPPSWAPRTFRGLELSGAVTRGRTVLLLYGERVVTAADARSRRFRYAFDLTAFTRPPNRGEFEPVTWAREADGVLYVSNGHLTYAARTKGRNAYLSAIDLETKRTRWRSAALVANARNFVVVGDFLVAGYGFTAEPDFLYLLDRHTGRVLDRLPVPTARERSTLRGDELRVRTYDRRLVVRLRD